MGTANSITKQEIQISQGSFQMNSIRIDSYEIKTSRNNLKVPVINDVHLHSMYNPAKEAQAIVSKYDQNLRTKNKVLVLGLGFAYHVYEICRKLESYHGDDYRVVVIEPNEQIYKDCKSQNLFPNKNIEVYTGEDLHKIYGELELVKFLIEKPSVISHPASFSLYTKFYKSFLEYCAPQMIKELTNNIVDANLNSYLLSDEEGLGLDDFIKTNVLSKSSFSNDFDHLILAYSHLSNGDF